MNFKHTFLIGIVALLSISSCKMDMAEVIPKEEISSVAEVIPTIDTLISDTTSALLSEVAIVREDSTVSPALVADHATSASPVADQSVVKDVAKAPEKSNKIAQAIEQKSDRLAFGFSFERFIAIAFLLILVYLLLRLIDWFLSRREIFGRRQKKISQWVHNLFLIYEPISILLIAVSLILTNPFFFGILALIILFAGLGHLRNYFSGRLVQLDRGINIGNQIRTGASQGVISEISRFGLRLKTAKGLQFLTYPQLLNAGYTLSAGEDQGGFYRLTIFNPSENENINPIRFKDLISSTPFLDWNHETEFSVDYDNPNHLSTRVLVREDHHLHDLISLIREWGYSCKVSKK